MPETRQLTILQLNDSHGYLESHNEIFWKGGRTEYKMAGGYARIATLFSQAQIEHPEGVLILDNGDTFHGTFIAVNSRGKALVPILNALALDGMTAHWEFAYGPAEFQALTHQLDYPMLAINCYEKETNSLIFSPGAIVDRNNLHIGIIGIAAFTVDKTMPESFSEGIYFTLGNEELSDYITHLREKERVDLIVVLSHLGYPQDLKLATEVDGIDVLLSGHTHNRLNEPIVVNKAIIIQSGCHGSFVGRLNLKVGDRGVRKYSHQLIPVEETIQPNSAIENLIEKTLKPHRSKLNTVVGSTRSSLTRWRTLESTMDNLLLEACLEATGTELAFSNGWRYGVPIVPGDVTMNDLWNIIPDNPPLSICDITGRELVQMMEDNLENTFSRDPFRQMGGYVKRCLGLNLYFKIENPYRKRIQEFFVGGYQLDPSKTYQACFLTVQGVPKHFGTNRRELNVRAIDALKQYFEQHSPVTSTLKGTIVPV